MILSILEEYDHRRVKELLPLQRAHESARNKCASAIGDFCGALDDGSPRLLEYYAQLKAKQRDYFKLRDRTDQFLVDMVEVTSSVVARASQCASESKNGKRAEIDCYQLKWEQTVVFSWQRGRRQNQLKWEQRGRRLARKIVEACQVDQFPARALQQALGV